ncbi:MAG: DUF63 family protein [Candidatus Diapherotrites archaeon]|nr:DUF63 family protein [Candidatus Diapherotrites archaeon]
MVEPTALIDSLPGYTVSETVIYTSLLLVGLFILLKVFNFLSIKFNKRLFWSLIPYIVLSGSLRVFVDRGLLATNQFTVSPGFYFLSGTFILIPLLLSYHFFKQPHKALKVFGQVGWAMALPILLFHVTSITNLFGPIMILFLSGGMFGVFAHIRPWIKLLHPQENIALLTATVFDVSTTTMSVFWYGYGEQHVIPNFFLNVINHPIALFLVKFPIVLFALWAVDSFTENKSLNYFLKSVLLVLILAPGVRDFIRLALLV